MEIAILFGMIIALLLAGVPIAVSLGLSSILFLLAASDSSLASVAQTLFSAFEGHFTLLAIPFFILASSFMSTGGVARRIIRFSIACVAVPLNHLRPTADEVKMAMKITPDTYSGVAVVVIAKVDRVRSVADPSFMPARIPRINAEGTISNITQNISRPVRDNRLPTTVETSSLKTVE